MDKDHIRKYPETANHAAVINLLVEKGYLNRSYPLTGVIFHPALLEALIAAPKKEVK
jgi:hypothetical protein